MCFLPLVCVLSSFVVPPRSANDGVYVPLASSSARCLDGSRAGMYFRASSSNSKTWIMYLEGGADCATQDRCQAVLKQGGGSNKGLPSSMAAYFNGRYAGSALIDPNSENNPNFFDANVAYVPYCTCDFHAGQRTAAVNGSFWFTGHFVIGAVVDYLEQQGVAHAKHFILGGGSSGGMGTFRNIDFVSARIKKLADTAIVVGVPLGGFYFFQQPYIGAKSVPVGMDFSIKGFKDIYPVHGAYVPAACAAQHPNDPWLCSQANVSISWIQTPVFVAEALTDRVVTKNHAGIPTLTRDFLALPKTDTLYLAVAQWTRWMSDALEYHIIKSTKAPRGLFAPACYDHTTFPTAKGPKISNQSFLGVFSEWLDLIANGSSATLPNSTKLLEKCNSPLCGQPQAIPPLK